MSIYKISPDDVKLKLFSQSAACSNPPKLALDEEPTEFSFTGHWIPNVKDCYAVTAIGDSMENALIFEGDMLVIDCGKEPQPRSIIAAWLNGEITIKRLIFEGMRVLLYPENDRYSPIEIKDHDDFRILGVVTSIHRKAE
ncbi:MAG: LexA family protein [Candidatus Kapaibacterium sp.]|jgi:SOS-response transcriptional repressor LexA|nr:hypothetical protein [Ignavibacteria bacterium]MBN8573479.1 hypothetical protein [Candidatus Kapabacteria bacterium]HRE58167.1 S24 family peptidase [Candidatus Kapabacteria bacterium]HRI32002.1 S24 family peptidase [Candidatus Kapabacteria bacterium]HRK58056.1 S24 family peptidase [Candidatus Kapabacteria bacterium]